MHGHVSAFDDHVGLGTVTADDGTEDGATEYLFHCVEIADGTRSIAVGTEVTFELMTKFGRPEAARLRPR